jgi:N-acetylmuramoyl-L-alanine amidase
MPTKFRSRITMLRCVVLGFSAVCLVGVCSSTHAAPQSEIGRMRAEYLRLRNVDPAGDDPVHRGSWEALASRIRGLAVQRQMDEESSTLRLLAAEAHLRLYRTRRDQAYLTTAKALVSPLTNNPGAADEVRAYALFLAGDIALYAGSLDAATQAYLAAQSGSGALDKRVQQRLQGLRNGTFSKFLPSPDREIPRVIRGRDARTREAAGPIVVLDPGHGGSDVGATSVFGGQEKEITLDIARRVKALLERRHQLKVQLTREDDTFVPLARRTAFANRKDGAVFVSLHVNASENHEADGFEAYYLDNTNDEASRKLAERENGIPPGEALDDLSFMLSDLIQSGKLEDSILLTRAVESGIREHVLTSNKKLRSLGVKKAPFFVLVGAHMPCSLIEMFFIDNPAEGRKLQEDSFRSALAAGVARGIASFVSKKQYR